jgi:hypothetical protein
LNPYNDFIGKDQVFGLFHSSGLVSIEAFPKRERFNYAFFTVTKFLSIIRSVSVLRPKMRAQGYRLHVDNAKPHNAALWLQETEEARLIRLP